MARFEREAKLLASLNHPNIAVIHGLEQAEGKRFLVLEYVEGETLAQRLAKGPLPVEEALGVCRQIAEALEAAHERGVIHRDLKPANVMIAAGDKVKILDFGLAKALAGEAQDAVTSQSPTLTEAMTGAGVILGTAAYMSPEQAKGKSVDKRADIWAFGCILYECLTGKRVFEGETVTETLAAILKGEPNWQALPATTPQNIRFVLRWCLEKDTSRRFRHVGDVLIEIEEVREIGEATVSVVGSGKIWRWAMVSAVVCVVVAALVAVVTWKLKPPEPGRVMRFDYKLPEGQQFSDISKPVLAVSADGTQFVYSTTEGIYLRSVDQLNARPIAGTDENSMDQFFSLDGQWIGYYSNNQLKKIAVSGGVPVTLADPALPFGTTWGVGNMIVYYSGKGIMRVSANGGTPELLVESTGETLGAP